MKKESIERIVDEIMSMLDDNVTSGDVCAFRCWCQDGFTFDNEEPDVRKQCGKLMLMLAPFVDAISTIIEGNRDNDEF